MTSWHYSRSCRTASIRSGRAGGLAGELASPWNCFNYIGINTHWSFVGSFHHGIVPAVVTAVVMAHPWAQAGSYNLASTVLPMQRISSSCGLTGYLVVTAFLDVLPPTTRRRRARFCSD